jgi:predicted DNA-binding protein YlxM (UPF0122 family)
MFKPEDFQMPLEKELRIQVINKEIDECTNVNALQENLKQCAWSLMRYQHLLTKVLESQLKSDMKDFLDKISVEVSDQEDANSG